MIQKVLLPKLGQTVEQATIEQWHKAEGDKVAKGDVLCEITTDKATLEVESYVRGTLLKILGQAGQELPVNSLIAIVGDPSDEIPAELLAGGVQAEAEGDAPAAEVEAVEETPAPKAEKPAKAPPPAAKPEKKIDLSAAVPQRTGRVFASPRARRLARDKHIPLAVLQGSGPDGRIVEADVKAYGAELAQVKVTPLAMKIAEDRGVDVVALARATGGKVERADVEAAGAAAPAAAPGLKKPEGGRVKLTAMRRIIAERMLQSKSDIPCYYLHMDVDFTELMAARKRLNARLENMKVSINDYIIMACAKALGEFPAVNSAWDGDGIIFRDTLNVSFAVALEEGLIVPVVKNIEGRDLVGVARESRSLIDKARGKRLLPDEYEGGAMTVSNLGMYGIKHFIPVVNPGESCIMGLGIIEERPVIRQGGIHIRQMMTMCLACDHRLIDGAVGAQFLERIRDLLENPTQLEPQA